jgi:hypothetical protein
MAKNDNMTRFVIQKHSKANDVHWDLMIEQADALATWRIDVSPEELTGNTISAEKIFDHELRFLTYEGPVNNGKGSVCIADSGICRIRTNDDDRVVGVFDGECVKGEFCLKQICGNTWEISFRKTE